MSGRRGTGRAWGGVLVAGLLVVGPLVGCAGQASPGGDPVEPTQPSDPAVPSDPATAGADVAEVVDAADCAVRETFTAYGSGEGDGLPAAPRAGAVPPGFVPVAAVECRWVMDVQPAPEPPQVVEPGETAPEAPVAPDAPAGTAGGARVDVVRLEGDLAPLLAQLARPDVPAQPDQACIAMFEVVPLLYLVDADDRAVRVAWPTDACGFLLDGAADTVAALTPGSTTTLTLP
ncbi:hypothetical protein [Cellulomonas phragmiteti]|uniref:Lipoprotein n=1 Tax=Cellulomonas phragmiteti TaxID=478780 RepID=A0ABQ4DP16_9CELL|nr:hypothetical protein [Cellulomonas phragmiteti]GIG41096.1 hypothetical protein Cph01nite_28580 [Cellulomonas phragmiteti]